MNLISLRRLDAETLHFEHQAKGALYIRKTLDGRQWISTKPPEAVLSSAIIGLQERNGNWNIIARTLVGNLQMYLKKQKRPFHKAVFNEGISWEGVALLNDKPLVKISLSNGRALPIVQVRNEEAQRSMAVTFVPFKSWLIAVASANGTLWLVSNPRERLPRRIKTTTEIGIGQKLRNITFGENLFDPVGRIQGLLAFETLTPIEQVMHHVVLLLWDPWVLPNLTNINDGSWE